jgi:hypothetical protein
VALTMLFRIITGLTEAAIVTKVLALIVGMRLLGGEREWVSPKNVVLLAPHATTGPGLVFLVWRNGPCPPPAMP